MESIRRVDLLAHAEMLFALYARNGEDDGHPRAVVADGVGELWLAEEDGRPVGILLGREQLAEDGRMRGFVDNLLVDAPARRRGVGSRLLMAAEAHYRVRGLVGTQIGGDRDNLPARQLYDAMGYRLVKEYTRTRPDGVGRDVVEPRFRMWKDFAPERAR